jgi:hypothetical protein
MTMAGVPIDVTEAEGHDPSTEEVPNGRAPGARKKRREVRDPEIEIEREITKRHLIEAITSVVVVVLYMAFTLFRDRESSVVVVDADGPEDDWDEEES